MNDNYIIKTIAIPEYDDNGVKTGGYITLEVVSMKKLKVNLQSFEAGNVTEERLYFVCFEKAVGKPRKLYVISAETDGEIEILKYEKYGKNNEFRSGNKANRRKTGTNRVNPDTKFGNGEK